MTDIDQLRQDMLEENNRDERLEYQLSTDYNFALDYYTTHELENSKDTDSALENAVAVLESVVQKLNSHGWEVSVCDLLKDIT